MDPQLRQIILFGPYERDSVGFLDFVNTHFNRDNFFQYPEVHVYGFFIVFCSVLFLSNLGLSKGLLVLVCDRCCILYFHMKLIIWFLPMPILFLVAS